MRLLSSVLSLVALASCSQTLLVDKKEVTGIPAGSNAVVAEYEMPADSAFASISRYLEKRKWIVRSSKEAMQISCDPKMVKGDIYIKPVIRIQAIGNNRSSASFSGTWSLRPMEQDKIDYIIASQVNKPQQITWQGYRTKSGAAYQNLLIMAKNIQATKIQSQIL